MAETHYIVDILVLLTAAIVAVLLFQRLGLGTVLGFLVAGMVGGLLLVKAAILWALCRITGRSHTEST